MKDILTLFLLTIFCFSCSDIDTTLIKTSANNSKTKKVVLLNSDGNATVDISYQISVYDFEYKLTGHELGNVFAVDRNHGATGLDTSSINFKWLSNDTVLIDFDKKLRTFIQENKINGVTILYQPR
ncbi:MAG: hypothetical protein J0I09_00055 [Sphingobacteriia bacterium]|nr:hypothetical protein [Sphingobacteriia bacterium]